MEEVFLFVGNSPAVDFINTEMISHDEQIDLLRRTRDLHRWAIGAGIISKEVSRARIAANENDLEQARHLRSAIRHLVDASIDRRKAPSAALRSLNSALEHPAPGVRIRDLDGHLIAEARPVSIPQLLHAVAIDATSVLTDSTKVRRLRRCAGHKCILRFLDTSRAGSRRWCSMAVCGNRSKVAAHQQRHRDT